MITGLAHISTKAPKAIVAFFALLIVGLSFYSVGVFEDITSDNQGFVNTEAESNDVQEVLVEEFGNTAPQGVVLFSGQGQDATSESFQAEIADVLSSIDPQPISAIGYAQTQDKRFISNDSEASYVLLTLDGDADQQVHQLEELQDVSSSLDVTVGGSVLANSQATEQVETDLVRAELIALPILAILLLVFFRSPIAALLPLGLGVAAIIGALAIVRALTNVIDIDQYAINIITILGLGLSVDYSLLVVNRFRDELASGREIQDAVQKTVRTAGRTVLFSGLTVIASLLALAIFPISFLLSIGVGGAAAVVVAMIGSLTVLPAFLQLLGHRINKWTIPGPKDRSGALLESVTRFVMRHARVALALSIVVFGLFAWQLSHIQFTTFTYRALPDGSSSRAVASAIANDFSSDNQTIDVLIEAEDNAPNYETSQRVTDFIAQQAGVARVETPTPAGGPEDLTPQESAQIELVRSQLIADSGSVLLRIYTEGDSTSDQSQQLVESLRNFETDGSVVRVGGEAAVFYDTLDTVGRYLPYAAVIIFGSMIILLTLLFRSIVLPLQAVVINLLALSLSFGVLVLLFQDQILNWDAILFTDGLDITIPLLIFAVAFGLSMDYAAFLYSRMREIYDDTNDPEHAVLAGVHHTGPIITAAALVLFVVVGAFATSSIAFIQQVGIGLSVAVLVDAFIVRLVVVPAVMKLFGRTSWYAPRWISRFSIKH